MDAKFAENKAVFENEFKELFAKYKVRLDNPFDEKVFKELESYSKNLIKNSNSISSTLLKYIKSFDNEFKIMTKNFETYRTENERKLQSTIELINTSYANKEIALKENIKSEISKTETEQYYIDFDAKNEIYSVEQKKQYHDMEFRSTISRFDYENQESKKNYQTIIDEYISDLDEEVSSLTSSYTKDLKQFDKESTEIANRLLEKINNFELQINEKQQLINASINAQKEKTREISIELNEAIALFMQERNKKIDEARAKNEENKAKALKDKEDKRISNNTESQNALKEYLISINTINDQNEEQASQYNNDIIFANKSYQENNLEIHREQTDKLKAIYSSLDSDINKKLNAKAINKEYYKTGIINSKNLKKKISNLEKKHKLEEERFRHEKALLDLDQSYLNKRIVELDLRENKYLQEISNIFELDLNLAIKLANYEYNIMTNKQKNITRIKNIESERDHAIEQAKLTIELEEIKSKLMSVKSEYDSLIKLKNFLHEIEDARYNETKNYNDIVNLIEIEKFKVLDENNQRQYDLNVRNAKLNLDFSYYKLDLHNKRQTEQADLKIELEEHLLTKKKLETEYNIKRLHLLHSEEVEFQNSNNKYQVDYEKNNVLAKRFEIENMCIQQMISTFILLSREGETYLHDSFDYIFKASKIKAENFNEIFEFILETTKLVVNHITRLLSSLSISISNAIDDRVKYESDFKFKDQYSDIEPEHQANTSNLNYELKIINDKILSCKEDFKNASTEVYRIEGQIHYKKETYNNSKDIKILQEINKLKDEIKTQQLRKKHAQEIEANNNLEAKRVLARLDDYNEKYKASTNRVQQMEAESARPFISFKDSITDYIAISVEEIEQTFMNFCNKEISPETIKNISLFERNQLFTKLHEIYERIYDISSKFYNEATSSMSKDNKGILLKFHQTLDTKGRYSSDKLSDLEDEYGKKFFEINKQINDCNTRIAKHNKYIDDLANKAKRDYDLESSNILFLKEESQRQFFNEYYALCSNKEDIIKNYKHNIRHINIKNYTGRNDLIAADTNQRLKINENFERIKHQKNTLITELPRQAKNDSVQNIADTKRVNYEIRLEMSQLKNKYEFDKKEVNVNLLKIDTDLKGILTELKVKYHKGIAQENAQTIINNKHIERQN